MLYHFEYQNPEKALIFWLNQKPGYPFRALKIQALIKELSIWQGNLLQLLRSLLSMPLTKTVWYVICKLWEVMYGRIN